MTDPYFKGNNKTAIFQALKQLLKNSLLTSLLIFILNYLLNFNVNEIRTEYILLVITTIFILLIHKTWKIYYSYKNYLDIMSTIYKFRIEETNPEVKLNSFFREYERLAELNKTKLDLLKSFSPIPLVVFIFTLLKENTFMISLNNRDLEFNDLIKDDIISTLIISLFIFWYLLSILSTWEKYQITLRAKSIFQAKSEEYKRKTS